MSNPFNGFVKTIFADGVPPIIAPDLRDFHGKHYNLLSTDEEERALVEQTTVFYRDNIYTVDYIIQGNTQYKVIYKKDTLSPFPHTVDKRSEQKTYTPSTISCSSASFRDAAYAMMKR